METGQEKNTYLTKTVPMLLVTVQVRSSLPCVDAFGVTRRFAGPCVVGRTHRNERPLALIAHTSYAQCPSEGQRFVALVAGGLPSGFAARTQVASVESSKHIDPCAVEHDQTLYSL